jgi:protein disulfide-isomerase
MLKSLGVQGYKLQDGQIVIGEKTVATEAGMVSLKALTEALGAKMVINASIGTIDVYQGGDKVAAEPGESDKKPATANASWGTPTWHTTWEAAASEAKTKNKPILIDFTGSDWCGWCVRLKKEVFDTDYFNTWAAKNVVLLEVDFPRGKPQSDAVKAKNQQLARKFGVSGYPSIFFANHNGDPIGDRFGYAEGGPEVWTKQAEQIMRKK